MKFRLIITCPDGSKTTLERKCASWRGAIRWRENQLKRVQWQSANLRLIFWPGHDSFNRFAAAEQD